MRRIVIDCDPGIDDAQAIMMAYQHPDTKIEAITTVAGNVDVKKTTTNALNILDVLGAEPIPVYAGASSALVEMGSDASYFHGESGLGNANLPGSNRKVENEPAALALIQLAKDSPGELELIAIGPLTNLALALRLDSELPSRYKRLVIMGGAYLAQGNTANYPVEFNLFADPDAAFVVFDSWPQITMVTWEATMANGIPLDFYKELLTYDNPRSKFMKDAAAYSLDLMEKMLDRKLNYEADPLAMAVMIAPDIVEESVHKYVQVERYGRVSRGMTVVDWWGAAQCEPNTDIVTKVNTERFFDLLSLAFK